MILAILQARTSSSRLAEKVLKSVLGRPMLSMQIERILHSKRINRFVVATSTEASDEKIERLCNEMNIECFRGSLDDVLDRFYRAALQCKAEHIIRLTGDCPVTDPIIIDDVISFYLNGQYDYVSNALEPTFPDGLDVEVFSFSALEEAWKQAVLHSERENVTLFINTRPGRFRIGSYKNNMDLSHLRWTVDEPEDFQLITEIFESLYPVKKIFVMNDILDLLKEKPWLKTINDMHIRNQGLRKSLSEDNLYMRRTKEEI
jgi:spore coat polysaccharide biosynthesis protein SpsF (cytidylyltransferase family)